MVATTYKVTEEDRVMVKLGSDPDGNSGKFLGTEWRKDYFSKSDIINTIEIVGPHLPFHISRDDDMTNGQAMHVATAIMPHVARMPLLDGIQDPDEQIWWSKITRKTDKFSYHMLVISPEVPACRIAMTVHTNGDGDRKLATFVFDTFCQNPETIITKFIEWHESIFP